jgi:hypothetical protein
MLKIYFIYKVAGKKIQKGYIKLNYVVCLSDTGSSCHVTVMGSLIVLVNKRADWNVPVSYIKYMSLCSALWFQHLKKHQKKTQFWKWSFSNILLYYLDVVWFGRWPEPWNFKTNHFRILYSFPSRISALFLLHTKTTIVTTRPFSLPCK